MKKSVLNIFAAAASCFLLGGALAFSFDAFHGAKTVAEPISPQSAQALRRTEDLFAATKNAEIAADYLAPAHIGEYKGIFVRAPENGASVVTLNHTLDLRMFTAKDVLLELLPVTTKPIAKRSELEISSITVRLTDAENPDVFAEMNVQCNPDAQYPYQSYAKARGDTQVLSGWNYDRGKEEVFSGGDYGRGVYANFYGRARENVSLTTDIRPVSLSYDYESAQIHANVTDEWRGTLVADLKNSESMKGEWGGFQSGKVILTVTAESENYNNRNSGFMILNFAGIGLSEQIPPDSEQPFFRVDTRGYSQSDLPQAEPFVPYPVFPCVSFDKFDGALGIASAEKTVETQVYFAGTPDIAEPIEEGYFVPRQTGAYVIEYRAADFSGNAAEKKLFVYCGDISQISYEFSSPLPQTIAVGEKYSLPEGRAAGVCGEYSAAVVVREYASGEEFLPENGAFVPLKAGMYLVCVRVEDFLGRTAEFSYPLQAKAQKTPVLVSAPSLPRALIAGKEVSFPDFEAYDYYSLAGRRIPAEKYYEVRSLGGALLKKVDPEELFSPELSWGKEIIVSYAAKSLAHKEKAEGSIKMNLIDRNESVNFSDYFPAENILRTAGNVSGESCIAFYFATDEAKIAYSQPLPLKGINVSFRVPAEAAAYDQIYVTLTDYEKADRAVTLGIKKSSKKTTCDFYINGEKTAEIFGNFDDTLLEDFCIKINALYEISDARGNVLGKISNYTSGESFGGFNLNLCYLSFSFGGVVGESALQITQIQSQNFDAELSDDYIGPELLLSSAFQSEQLAGKVIVPGAIGVDVLYGVVSTEAEICRADTGERVFFGKVGAQGVGVPLVKSGKYTVTYRTSDDRGNYSSADYALNVYDVSPLKIVLSGEVQTRANQGDTVSLPEYALSGKSGDVSAIVYVICPRGGLIDVSESMRFSAEQKGIYKVYYYAVRERENSYAYALNEYEITVE